MFDKIASVSQPGSREDMERHTLERTGQAPFVFTGEQIAHVSGQYLSGAEANRYHEIGLYQTSGGNWILHIQWHTHWQGEVGASYALKLANPVEIRDALDAFNPLQDLQGFPPTKHYEDKQQRLEDNVVRLWDQTVSSFYRKVLDAGVHSLVIEID